MNVNEEVTHIYTKYAEEVIDPFHIPKAKPMFKISEHKTPQHISDETVKKAEEKRERKRLKRMKELKEN